MNIRQILNFAIYITRKLSFLKKLFLKYFKHKIYAFNFCFVITNKDAYWLRNQLFFIKISTNRASRILTTASLFD